MQMDWTEKTKEEFRNQPYNPDEVWTIEGPTRKAQEKVRRTNAMLDLKHSLENQKTFFHNTLKSAREGELMEGKRICDDDIRVKDEEDQMHDFKKKVFAAEMRRTWEKQAAYKKSLQKIEDLY